MLSNGFTLRIKGHLALTHWFWDEGFPEERYFAFLGNDGVEIFNSANNIEVHGAPEDLLAT